MRVGYAGNKPFLDNLDIPALSREFITTTSTKLKATIQTSIRRERDKLVHDITS